MSDLQRYSHPEKNILFALAQGVYELPSSLVSTFNNPKYSTHSHWGKFTISVLQTFIRNLHYKHLLLFSPNRTIERQLQRKTGKYSRNLHHYGTSFDNFPGAIWLHETPNRTSSDPVIVFYHGGGYIFQFRTDTHLKFLNNLIHALPLNYSVLLVDYPLSSHPAPLQYNIKLWEWLFIEQKLQNVITMGDSAGGHLILSTIAHIQSSNTLDVPLPPNFKHILISPWINLSSKTSDLDVSRNTDILDPERSYKWGLIFKNDDMSILDVQSFKYDTQFCVNTLITIGELELLFEPVKEFAETNQIQMVVEDQGVHDQVTMESFLGRQDDYIMKKIVKFILSI